MQERQMANKHERCSTSLLSGKSKNLKINRTRCLEGSVEMSALTHHECKCKLAQLWEEGDLVESNVYT